MGIATTGVVVDLTAALATGHLVFRESSPRGCARTNPGGQPMSDEPWPRRDRGPPSIEPLSGPDVLPMVPVDFDVSGLRITGCRWCAPTWWAELVVVAGAVHVREWHQQSCPEWGDLHTSVAETSGATPLDNDDQVADGDGFVGLRVVRGTDGDPPDPA